MIPGCSDPCSVSSVAVNFKKRNDGRIMQPLDPATLELLWHDADAREVRLREILTRRLRENPPPRIDDQVVATYFFALRTMTLKDAVGEIAYHATSGVKHPPAGSLLEQC